MRTNIVLDDKLIRDAMKVTGAKTKREVVDIALRRLVQTKRQKSLLGLAGKGLIDPDYDYKEARSAR